MSGNAGFQLSFFDTGKQRGVIAYFFAKASDAWNTTTVSIDLSDFYNRGQLKQIGSIKQFNQYATLVVKDNLTGSWMGSAKSEQVCYPINTTSKTFEITRYDGLNSASSFEITFYEREQQSYVIGVPLP